MASRRASLAPSANQYRERFSGWPAHGARPAIGGTRRDGRATSGTSLCRRKLGLRCIGWSAICSAGDGTWKGLTISHGYTRIKRISNLFHHGDTEARRKRIKQIESIIFDPCEFVLIRGWFF